MVVFTCQHCGDGLKKNVVIKHYATRCRKTPYLTCVDCLKDFRGDDYSTHNTCITEQERYGDKNYKPKPTAVKQIAWMDVVLFCAKENKNPEYKYLFSKLVTYDNVPRKREKFVNFIKSAMPRMSPDYSREIFEVIQNEFLNQKNTASTEEGNHEQSVENHNESTGVIQDENSEVNCEKKKKKKKTSYKGESNENVPVIVDEKGIIKNKKSKKHRSLSPNAMDTVESEEINQMFNVENKVSQRNGFLNETSEQLEEKENIQDNHNSTEINHQENDTSHENVENLSKKELKKLKKKQKYEAELKLIEESNNVDCTPEDTNEEAVDNDNGLAKRSKKHKKRKAAPSESEDNTGKRLKAEDIEEMEDSTKDENDDEKKHENKKLKFNWEEVIREVLQKSSDQEMSIKRISKKVLAEYQAQKGNRESYEQLISKFNKKINKTIGVRVLKDRAKLISNE